MVLRTYEMEGTQWVEIEEERKTFESEIEAFEAFIKAIDGHTVNVSNDLNGGYKAFDHDKECAWYLEAV
jgi:hypothetical protein